MQGGIALQAAQEPAHRPTAPTVEDPRYGEDDPDDEEKDQGRERDDELEGEGSE